MSKFPQIFRGLLLVLCAAGVPAAIAQSSATVTETVNQRGTIGVVKVSPASGLTTGATATFTYVLNTAGAPAPTSETVQFLDGASNLGATQAITSTPAVNLLPYAQVDASHGWTTSGTAPTITINTGTGPDGSTNSATQVAYPSTAGGSSGVVLAVPGTAYANLAMTLSVWAKSASAATLTLALADSPSVAASNSTTCALTTTWQRCKLTYTFPSNAGTGVAATISSVGVAAQTVSLWGVQVEQAANPSPYVSTIGTARPTGAAGGSVTFAYSSFTPGTHNITVSYPGDTNYVTSTSASIAVVVAQAAPTISLTPSPVSPIVYGHSLALTSAITVPGGSPTATGTVQFFDGATSLGTGTLNGSGSGTLTLSALTSLPAGTHSITAVYSGDTNYATVTSTALPYTVTKQQSTLTATSSRNPATYGDSVTYSVLVATTGGVIPTGTVAIVDGGTSLGTVTLDATGAGTLTVPLFTAGTHTITFTYSGDSNYN